MGSYRALARFGDGAKFVWFIVVLFFSGSGLRYFLSLRRLHLPLIRGSFR